MDEFTPIQYTLPIAKTQNIERSAANVEERLWCLKPCRTRHAIRTGLEPFGANDQSQVPPFIAVVRHAERFEAARQPIATF